MGHFWEQQCPNLFLQGCRQARFSPTPGIKRFKCGSRKKLCGMTEIRAHLQPWRTGFGCSCSRELLHNLVVKNKASTIWKWCHYAKMEVNSVTSLVNTECPFGLIRGSSGMKGRTRMIEWKASVPATARSEEANRRQTVASRGAAMRWEE